jgi:hypothetical protein
VGRGLDEAAQRAVDRGRRVRPQGAGPGGPERSAGPQREGSAAQDRSAKGAQRRTAARRERSEGARRVQGEPAGRSLDGPRPTAWHPGHHHPRREG